MSEADNFEIRFCLIGESGIGKRSIINRFRILNCSSTIDNAHAQIIKSSSKGLKDLKSENTSNSNKNNINSKGGKGFNNTLPNSQAFSNTNTVKYKENTSSLLHNINNNKSKTGFQSVTGTNYSNNNNNYNNTASQKFQSEKFDANFTKVLSISKFTIDLRFFPIINAEKFKYNENIHDELEELEKEHQMKFDKVKSDLEKIIMKASRPNMSFETKFVFVFVFDLENFETFDKIKVYYEELNKFLSIDDKHYKILLGNKLDRKTHFKSNQKENLFNFIEKNNFKYYEVSTKMFYNFEILFENIFFDNLMDLNEEFKSDYFKERFNYVMKLRPTFAKSERNAIKSNNVPGPQQYNANIYNIANEEDFRNAFERKERFKTKIFVNKLGPVFDFKKEDFLKQNKNKKKEVKKEIKQINEPKTDDEYEILKKKKIKETNIEGGGFSMGIRPAKLNLRKLRKDQYKKLNSSFDNIFDFDNITKPREPVNKLDYINSADDETVSTRRDSAKKRAEQRKLRGLKILKKMKKIEERKNAKITKQELLDEEEWLKIKPKTINKLNLDNESKNRNHKVIKKDLETTPGPAAYNISKPIDLTKGFTFGGRYNVEKKPEETDQYTKIELKSDADEIVKNPKFP